MSRPAMTPTTRAAIVTAAANDLPLALALAQDRARQYGPTHPDTLAAWGAVEACGASVHRQARMLAGKRKGG